MLDKNIITFQIKYDKEIIHLFERKIFTVIKQNGKIFLEDLSQNIKEVETLHSDRDAEDFLANPFYNYSNLQIDKRNQLLFVESHIVANIQNVEKLNLCLEENLVFTKEFMKETATGKKAILLLNNMYDTKDESFIIASFDGNKSFSLTKISEKIDEDTSLEYLKVEENKIKIAAHKDDYQTFLVVGDITVSSEKKGLSTYDSLNLAHLKNDTKSYLNFWYQYNEKELNKEYKAFLESGYITYEFLDKTNRSIKLYFNEENFNKIRSTSNKFYYIGSKKVKLLFDTAKLDDYKVLEKELLENNEMTMISKIHFETINKDEKSLSIELRNIDHLKYLPLRQGYICLSLLGNQISYKRRNAAKERILNGCAGIPKLFTWFTDNPEPSSLEDRIEINNTLISAEHPLTMNQREAVDIILNTPDIAIIQGPPGTGKTTVIREALIQLNSLKENKYDFGNNLLTGFRQETVNNLIENTQLFGLPAIKISQSEEDLDDNGLKIVVNYVNELTDRLKTKYKDLAEKADKYLEFKREYVNYKLFDNSIDSTINIIKKMLLNEYFKYDGGVSMKLIDFKDDLMNKKQGLSFEEKEFFDFLYKLPLCKASYDDNIEDIRLYLDAFKDNEKFTAACKEISKCLDNFDPLTMKNVRKKYILKMKGTPELLVKYDKKKEITDYLDSLFEKMKIYRLREFDGQEIAILDYIDSLYENPKLIQDTILEYAKVLGATNQYCVSKNMFDIKNDQIKFDNVFIDEAATSSPLDLFIPMSLAKKKIILVGDHKQLPNITDEDLVEEVETELKIKDQDNKTNERKLTLFEVLMQKAKQLEQKDGRKRVITLDTQFRMHPELGKIVSDNFYDGIIKSIRPAEEFIHDYNGQTNFLKWIDVPYNPNLPRTKYRLKNSYSRVNIPEAEIIVQNIKDNLETKGDLTIGVITIFKDQAETITKMLGKEIIDKYDIKVGTVDAFQGREFDIVYLSLVYVFNESKNYSRLGSKESDSLLCVALSRQKRELIIVGDMDVYSCSLAKEKVNKIYNICMKCKENGWYE